ncbi:hypothetical protein EON63_04925 [archaeon]|nr:MAG: hypothetical protein EON63_04925 [archaeon]
MPMLAPSSTGMLRSGGDMRSSTCPHMTSSSMDGIHTHTSYPHIHIDTHAYTYTCTPIYSVCICGMACVSILVHTHAGVMYGIILVYLFVYICMLA